MRQIALVQRHVLDADDALVDLEFDDPIDEQEWEAVRQDPFDRCIVERESQIHFRLRLYCLRTVSPAPPRLAWISPDARQVHSLHPSTVTHLPDPSEPDVRVTAI